MPLNLTEKQAKLLDEAYYIWFTTVRADGTPQPTPVWFIQDGDSIVIFSMPDAQKVKNIRGNSKVALNFNPDHDAEEYVVITGEATLEENGAQKHDHSAYFAKYGKGIADLNMTPESMAATYSTLIRVTPAKVRSE